MLYKRIVPQASDFGGQDPVQILKISSKGLDKTASMQKRAAAFQKQRQARLAMMQEYMANRQKAIQQLALSAVRNRNALGRKFRKVKSLDALPLHQKIKALQEGQADLAKLPADELNILMQNLQTQSKKGRK